MHWVRSGDFVVMVVLGGLSTVWGPVIGAAAFYPAPVLLQLTGFNQVQASVFQMARAPGKKLVYLGAVLLIIGVFAMLYIRERRLWIWLAPAANGGTLLQAALSTTRRTLDVDAEFDQLRGALLALPVKDTSA